MKTLEIQDVYKINALTKAIEKNILFQQQLSKTTTRIEVTIKVAQNQIFANAIQGNFIEKEKESDWKQNYHEITKDYLATLRVHTNTLIQKDQKELFQLLNDKTQPEKCTCTTKINLNQLFDVHIQKVGSQKLRIIKIIKKFTKLNLRESKNITDCVPCWIETELNEFEATEFKTVLNELGAMATIRQI